MLIRRVPEPETHDPEPVIPEDRERLKRFTVHPVLEELFWRGGRAGARRPVPDWRDVAFAGYHVPVLWFFVGPGWVALSFVVLAAGSWLWRLADHRFGGLGVPLVSHAAADLSIMVAATLIARHGPW